MAVDSLALTVGTGINGVLAYVFFALATRTLGPEGAAPVAQLWTYWSATGAVFTFPLQHWVIRTIEAEGAEGSVRRALPRIVAVAGLVAMLATGVAYLARRPLFLTDGPGFPLLVGMVTVGACFGGVVRGGLGARRRFVATALLIAGENVLRVAAAAAAVLASLGSAAFGVALSVGPLVGLAWPTAYRFAPSGGATGGQPVLGFLGHFAGGSFLAQVVFTGGPIFLALVGGTPTEVTALFVALAVFRAPWLVALGIVAQVTGAVTGLVVAGRHRTLRRILHGVAGGTVVLAAVTAAVAWWAGAAVIELIFGPGTAPSPAITAVVGAGSIVGLSNLVLQLLLVARHAALWLSRAWAIAVLVGAGVVLASPGGALTRVAVGFALAEVVAFLVQLGAEAVLAGRARRRSVGPSRAIA